MGDNDPLAVAFARFEGGVTSKLTDLQTDIRHLSANVEMTNRALPEVFIPRRELLLTHEAIASRLGAVEEKQEWWNRKMIAASLASGGGAGAAIVALMKLLGVKGLAP